MKKILSIIIIVVITSSCTLSKKIDSETDESNINKTIISTDKTVDIVEVENQPNY